MIHRLSEEERTLASHSRGRVYEFMPWIARHPQRAGAATIPLTAESLQSFWAHRRRDRHAAVRRVRGGIRLGLGRCAGRPSRAARGQPGPIAHPALWRDRHGGLVRGGTFGLLRLVGFLAPLRASTEDEIAGLDISLHGEALQ